MSFSKKKREIVCAKYDGHCAYCGRAIDIKDMQVDHFFPLRTWGIEDTGSDDILNLMPACRMCNHYKRANSLEQFRRYIAEIPQKLRCDYIFKIGVAYGNIIENEKPIIFYFEVQSEKASKMATEECGHGEA
nr:MAG TPA: RECOMBINATION ENDONUCLEASE VII [Caudoviricetes sp.]